MHYINIAEPCLGDAEWEAVKEPISTGWLTQGPKVKEFETKFAKKHDVKYAYATTSCTTALHLALAALGITEGDYVIVPSFTWIATVNVVEYCGATPIFCDSDISTYNMDTSKLEAILKKVTSEGKRVKAVIPVHLFGLMADMDPIVEMSEKYGFAIVEDAACAAGAMYGDRFAGSIGDIGCFSFHPRKIITTGEGGMCTTNAAELAERLSCLRSHGATISEEQRHSSNSPYLMPDFNVLGYNYRLSDLQGAVGSVQVEKLDGFIQERRKWAAYYKDKLKDVEWLLVPEEPSKCRHSYQAFVCRMDSTKIGYKRNEIMQKMQEAGIGTRAGTHAVHELGYYREKYNLRNEDYPVASELYANTISLPLHNKMKKEDYDYVIKVLSEIQ